MIQLAEQCAGDTHVQAVLDAFKLMDLTELRQAYRGTGSSPFLPECMLAVALFEILNGQSSPSVWCRDANTRRQCRFLGRGIEPSKTTWYDFRNRVGKIINHIFKALVVNAIQDGLVDVEEGFLDGTFSAASAWRHKIFNLSQINRRLSVLKRVIARLDDPNQTCSKRPLNCTPHWVGRTPIGRQGQLARLRQAKRKILEKVQENRLKAARYQRDEEKILVSPADAEAAIGKDKFNVIRPLYNTQCLCSANDVVLAYEVQAKCNDQGSLMLMLQTARTVAGDALKVIHADCGYSSVNDIQDCEQIGIELYAPIQENNGQVERKAADGSPQIPSKEFYFDEADKTLVCPSQLNMKYRGEVQIPRADGRMVKELRYEQTEEHCRSCPLKGRCLQPNVTRRTVTRLKEQPLLDAQHAKMQTELGHRSVRLRRQIIERRFADGKLHRNQGIQNGRGLDRVRAEVGLLFMAQNILTLYNLRKRRKTQEA